MNKLLKILFESSRREPERNEQVNENNEQVNEHNESNGNKEKESNFDKIETLKNNAEEILAVISYDWKKQALVDDVIEPMIKLLEEQQVKIEELENRLS